MNTARNQAIEQALVGFFVQAARKDLALVTTLKQEPCFWVGKGRWCFTLPELFSFLQHQDNAFTGIDYKQFRQLLFNSPVNRAIKLHGAEIVIADNRSRVDQSTYALLWPAEERP